jgi:cobalt/nickel transport system permease protein
MIREPFAKGNSPIHHTHPMLRIVLASVFSITVALMTQPGPLTLALCFSLGLIIWARLPAKPLLKRVTMAGAVLAFVWLVVPTTHTGDPMAHIGPIAISSSGVQLCMQITLKAMTILLAFIALVATMPTAAMGYALHQLGTPAKLVQLLLLAYRYIFVIEQEYQRLFRAAKMRNFHPATNMHTYRTYAYMVGMLFVRASERATRVYQAMQCRGFKGRFFTLVKFPPTRWNIVLGTSVGLIDLLIIYFEWIK